LWWLLFWTTNAMAAASSVIFAEPLVTLSQMQAYVWWDVSSYVVEAFASYVAAALVKSISLAEEGALRSA
jgi:hypothetical protein